MVFEKRVDEQRIAHQWSEGMSEDIGITEVGVDEYTIIPQAKIEATAADVTDRQILTSATFFGLVALRGRDTEIRFDFSCP